MQVNFTLLLRESVLFAQTLALERHTAIVFCFFFFLECLEEGVERGTRMGWDEMGWRAVSRRY